MIRAKPRPPLVTQSKSRVRAWLATAEVPKARIAAEAGIDEKTIRLAIKGKWNPRANTLAKLEALIPQDWQPAEKSRAA